MQIEVPVSSLDSLRAVIRLFRQLSVKTDPDGYFSVYVTDEERLRLMASVETVQEYDGYQFTLVGNTPAIHGVKLLKKPL